jgi:hypothetical protein
MSGKPDYVHGLLAHLERCGFEGSPRFSGAVTADARLVRQVYDLTAGTEFAAGAEVACHLSLSQPQLCPFGR